MNYKIKLFFVNCILLSCLSLIIIKAILNYFYNYKQETISFFDQDEYEQEWLRTQSCLKRYDYNVFNNNEIIEILKMNDNNNYYFSSYFDLNHPGYNDNNSQRLGLFYFKDSPKGLITVYFKYRDNPFNKKYPTGDNKYTLDDLLKYEICIEEAHIFWNANQKEIDPNLNIHQQIFTIYPDQNNDDFKKELIQNYLYDNKIIENKRFVDLNCYNTAFDTEIAMPFKSSIYENKKIQPIATIDLIINIATIKNNLKISKIKFNNFIEEDGCIRRLLKADTQLTNEIEYLDNKVKRMLPIEAVYFDNGIRYADSNIEINDLLKLSNGAKNVYLFQFEYSQIRFCHSDSGATKLALEYNDNNQQIKNIGFYGDNKRISFIDEYNKTGWKTNMILNFYNDDGRIYQQTHYYNDGHTIKQNNSYNKNEILIKEIIYGNYGKIITQINEYNENGQKTKETEYNPDGRTIKQIQEYNEDEKLIKKMYYMPENKTIKQIETK
ncbi:DUF2963 domain-containing protein [Candidatus Phytoplasma sp. AldY-WA1]|uniref:DUF2963 domain-containing protein n=1 Tax=Candidatus Phytoplasma sp. AldY-WA1 TaxID=2852100 RepID=UPI0025500EC6|nr:DUF2963 domain-containing protein [Candidatus Phytoplasma sp. AldY-WA1]